MTITCADLRGTFTALVTPFSADGIQIDFSSLAQLIEFQLAAKVDGFVICGSTGEAVTLSAEEYAQVLREAVKIVGGRVPCIAGVGSSNTKSAITMAQAAEESGCDAVLVSTPPYNKPPQKGIIEHFRAIKTGVSIPLIAYNIPGRAALNILPETIVALTRQELIIGLKESAGSFDQLLDILLLLRDRIAILSGEDSLVHACMASGGHGTISASANVIPEIFVDITSAALLQKWQDSLTAQFLALPIIRALFMETNPIPVKTALMLKGVIKSNMVRLPLLPAIEGTIERLSALLVEPDNSAVSFKQRSKCL